MKYVSLREKLRLQLATATGLTMMAVMATATTYYVDPVNGSDSYDGKAAEWAGGESKVGPKETIYAATTLATKGGDVLMIAGGHYALTNTVTVRGPITVRGSDDPANPTILDGQGERRVMQMGDIYRANAYFNDLVITNGYCETDNGAGFYGISFNINYFSNCTFAACSSSIYGGALYARGNVVFQDCRFRNCETRSTAADGIGGAVCVQAYMGDESARMTNCEFTACSSRNRGGAVYVEQGLPLILSGCAFTNNVAPNGGAMAGTVPCLVTNSTFVGNLATNGAGGVLLPVYALKVRSRFVDCVFKDNIASNGCGGVTIVTANSVGMSFRGCTFERNGSYQTTDPNWSSLTYGGAIGCKGTSGSSLAYRLGPVEDCTFRGNFTDGQGFGNEQTAGGCGGAIGTPFSTVTGCTFEDNYAQFAGGAIMPVYNTSVSSSTFAGLSYLGIAEETLTYEQVISNCTFIGNRAGGPVVRTAFGPTAGGAVCLCGRGYTGASCAYNGRAESWMGQWKIADCSFVSNRVDGVLDDPGFYVRRLGGALHVPAGAEIVRCGFTNNWSEGAGGAISGAITNGMRDCSFVGNYVICTNFVKNRFFGSGGAVLLQTGLVGYEQEIARCSFVSNSVVGDCGAAVAFAQGNLKMSDCQFYGNCQATNACAIPVQIYTYDGIPYGGALAIDPSSYGFITTYTSDRYSNNNTITVEVNRCSFVDNCTQGAGGGLSVADKNIKNADIPGISGSIRNCFFKNNEATYRRPYHNDICYKTMLEGNGGGLFVGEGQAVSVENCTFVDNSAETVGGQLDNMSALSGVTNCVFYGGSDASEEGATADLRLNDATLADYTFAPLASPLLTDGYHNRKSNANPFSPEKDCAWTLKRIGGRDGGLALAWMTDDATDLLGNPRVKGTAPDLGCFERQRLPGQMIILR